MSDIFQPRFPRPQPFYNDLSPLSYMASPSTQVASAAPTARRRGGGAVDAHAVDRVGALLVGDGVSQREIRPLGRSMVPRDPNAQSDPTVASRNHPKLFDSHVRHLEPLIPTPRAEGRRALDAPGVVEHEPMGHKRHVVPPILEEKTEAVGDLLVDPCYDLRDKPRAVSSTAKAEDTARQLRRVVADFVAQRAGGVRGLWLKFQRREYLEPAPAALSTPRATNVGSVPVCDVRRQLEVAMGRDLDESTFSRLMGRPALERISLQEFIETLGL
jgi:hypothetical protein